MQQGSAVKGRRVTLFVGGLSFNITEDDLKNYFSRFCSVIKVVLLRDRSTGLTKGYGFVTLEDGEKVKQVTHQTNIICGRRVECQIASKKSDKQRVDEERRMRKVYVSRIPASMSNQELYNIFVRFGEIHNCYIIQNIESSSNKPYGYVEFRRLEDAQELLRSKTHINYGSSKLTLQQFKEKPTFLDQHHHHVLDDDKLFQSTTSTQDPAPYICSHPRLHYPSSPDRLQAAYSVQDREADTELKSVSSTATNSVNNYRFNLRARGASYSFGQSAGSFVALHTPIVSSGSSPLSNNNNMVANSKQREAGRPAQCCELMNNNIFTF